MMKEIIDDEWYAAIDQALGKRKGFRVDQKRAFFEWIVFYCRNHYMPRTNKLLEISVVKELERNVKNINQSINELKRVISRKGLSQKLNDN